VRLTIDGGEYAVLENLVSSPSIKLIDQLLVQWNPKRQGEVSRAELEAQLEEIEELVYTPLK